MSVSRTIVIGCAGMGNRLGLGCTKALVEVDGKPLIIRHLEQLSDESDIRIVVGYQAKQVIELVNSYRKDILFVFNHDYKTTGTGASVMMAAQRANDYVLSLDGDLLIHPDDMKAILSNTEEFIGGGVPNTEDPWLLQTHDYQGHKLVNGFSQVSGEYEWTGVVQVKTERLLGGRGHVYQLLEPLLPIKMISIRTREVDTIGDFENAERWVKNGYK